MEDYLAEKNVTGRFVFGIEHKIIQHLTQEDKEHRNLFMANLKTTSHIRMNSFSEKEQTTRKPPEQIGMQRAHLMTVLDMENLTEF